VTTDRHLWFDSFGWRNGVPNIADKDSDSSVRIATAIFESLGVTQQSPSSAQEIGTRLERSVETWLQLALPDLRPDVSWRFERRAPISRFAQYRHLDQLRDIVDDDATGLLAEVTDRADRVKPDICVAIAGIRNEAVTPMVLHAAVACKFSIRPDRVQAIGRDAAIMVRHRRGRLPHAVAVTAEPVPTRLVSLAQGTGDVDCTYHVAFDELVAAADAEPPESEQPAVLDRLIRHGRLRPAESLLVALAL